MDISSVIETLATGISFINVLQQGHEWITGTTVSQRDEHFKRQVINSLEEIRNGIYRLSAQEVYDTNYTTQRVVQDNSEIGQAVEPIHSILRADVVVSNPIISPDKFLDTFRQNPEDLLIGIRPLAGELIPPDYANDPTLRPVIFKKWGQHFIGFIKVGYAKEILHLDYKPLLSTSNVKLITPTQSSPINFDWVIVPASDFWMGSGSEQHRIFLPTYKISRTPVTNAQYQLFVEAMGGHHMPEHWQGGRIPKGKEEHPVVYVTWHDAQAFCRWAYVRLPSEAEWEKAARGTDRRTFPWGNKYEEPGFWNLGGPVRPDTTPVHSHSLGVSPYGCLDMLGNVWEWTQSQQMPYPYNSKDGREDETGTAIRIIRGGSYLSQTEGKTPNCTVRSARYGTSGYEDNGFRVVTLSI